MADSTSQLPMGMSLDADPSKGYAELHKRGHVMIDGGSCVVVGYEACQSVLRDHRRFSSEMDITTMAAGIAAEVGTNGLSAPAEDDGEVVHDRLAASMGEVLSRMLPFVDPPDHSRLRSVVQRAFAPKALAQWEPRIREITGSLLDRIEPGEPFELMSGLARPLPVIVMAEMLGLDTGALDTDYWSDPAVGMMGMIGLDNGAAMFGEVIEARRRESRDDLISLMVQAEEAGQMTPEEVLSTCSLLFAAGNVTTTGLLGNAVHQLGGYPDQYHALGADPSMIPNAVEEVLRWDPPIAAIPPRRALEDAAVDGVVLPAGSGVTLFTAAANRDPAHFDDPEHFDITRRNAASHVTFGAGIHFCIGAPLSRIEGRIALEELLDRVSDLELVGDDGSAFDGSSFLRARHRVVIKG